MERIAVVSTELPVPSCQSRQSNGYRVPGTGNSRYHSFVHELAERVLQTIRKKQLLKPGDRVAVAVSGGADSVALLLLLLELRSELGIVLSVAHVNHKLRGEESDEDEEFVTELSRHHSLDLHARKAPLESNRSAGIEGTAREFRYNFFRELLSAGKVSTIATAHTLDDQAETVLLRVLRGTGVRGLAGIYPRLRLDVKDRAVREVVRPLLGFHRHELAAFLGERGQGWREDLSNRDLAFLRNRVRHKVLPLLKESFGPGAVDNLADLAEIARAEEEHWEDHAEVRAEVGPLRLVPFLQLPIATQRRLIRNWLEKNAEELSVTFRLIEEIRELAQGPVGKQVESAGGYTVRRMKLGLGVERGDERGPADYEYPLRIPGRVEIAELGICIEAVMADTVARQDAWQEQWLDPARLPKHLLIRNWRPGDRFWPAHTKEERKVKELLSDRHLTGVVKKSWPVVVAEGIGLVWVRGFPIPSEFRPRADAGQVLWIRDTELNPEPR